MNNEFDQYAKSYDEILNKSVKISGEKTGFFAEVKIKLMYEQIHRSKLTTKKFLDFGCGTGNAYQYFCKYFPEAMYYGIDTSKASIDEAKQKWKSPHFCYFDGSRLPFQNEKFDIVFSFVVFHHIPVEHYPRILEEIYRVLKPNGIFLLFEHNSYNPIVRKVVNDCPFDKGAVLLSPQFSKRLFHQSPFQSCRLRYFLFFPRFLKFVRFLERYLALLPLGAQYYIQAQKR